MTDFRVVIPARLNSTRLPRKALADIGGKPMVRHVYEQARRSGAERVIVATDSMEIVDALADLGPDVIMTSDQHPSGTDRLAEVVNLLALEDDEIIVNVQGDEPLIPPAVIDQVARNLATRPGAGMATLCERLEQVADLFNPNIVKVVFDAEGMAGYFSRAPIPWQRSYFSVDEQGKLYPGPSSPRTGEDGERPAPGYRHIGLYAYRAGMLRDYTSWSPCAPERAESLEQLRALFNGVGIHVDEACIRPPAGVDTAEDLARVRKLLADRG